MSVWMHPAMITVITEWRSHQHENATNLESNRHIRALTPSLARGKGRPRALILDLIMGSTTCSDPGFAALQPSFTLGKQEKRQFNYTHYTVAHKWTRQLFPIPASYENNIALAKPDGHTVHARPNPFSLQPFSSLALYQIKIILEEKFLFLCTSRGIVHLTALLETAVMSPQCFLPSVVVWQHCLPCVVARLVSLACQVVFLSLHVPHAFLCGGDTWCHG